MFRQLFFIGFTILLSFSACISQRACTDLATSNDRFLHYNELDLFFDSNGRARYTDHHLDSIVNYNCDSLFCNEFKRGSYYYYKDGQLDSIASNFVINSTITNSFSKLKYDVNYGDPEYMKAYDIVINYFNPNQTTTSQYDFDRDLLVTCGSSSESNTSTTNNSTRITRNANGIIERVLLNTNYQGGLPLNTSTRINYEYHGDTLKSIENVKSETIFGEDISTTTLSEYEYLDNQIIIKRNGSLYSKSNCESDGLTGNLIESYYRIKDGIWDLEKVTTLNVDLLPITIQYYINNIQHRLTTYYYSDFSADYPDLDGDGYIGTDDCDETNPNINVAQLEIPYNGYDDDCDVRTLDDDFDQDGYLLAEDCDDHASWINPGAIDHPHNDIDEDCDGDALIIPGIHFLNESIFNGNVVNAVFYDTVCVNQNFTVLLVNYDEYSSYNWDFGNDSGIILDSISSRHRLSYETPGLKLISVEITDSIGGQLLIRDSLMVLAEPIGDWSFEIISGTEVKFNAEADPDSEYGYFWILGDSNYENLKNPIHTYDEYGIYNVTLFISNQCGSEKISKEIDLSISALEKTNPNQEIKIFPNPSVGIFNIHMTEKSSHSTLEIYNVEGIRVWEQPWNYQFTPTQTLDLRHLNTGVYYLKISAYNRSSFAHIVIVK